MMKTKVITRNSRRALAGAAIVASAVGLTATPAAAHQVFSNGRAQRVAEVRTVLAPSIWFNLHELGIGCPANATGRFYPTWTVSNVTSSSAYVRTLKITFYPGANGAELLGSYLVNGNGNTVWNGYWDNIPVSTSGRTKTFTFNRTVTFGRNGKLYFQQYFMLNVGGPGICSNPTPVYFYLSPV